MDKDNLKSVLHTGYGLHLHSLPKEVTSEFCAKEASKIEIMEAIPLCKSLEDQRAESKLIQGLGGKGQNS